jgi:hypothetical protein
MCIVNDRRKGKGNITFDTELFWCRKITNVSVISYLMDIFKMQLLNFLSEIQNTLNFSAKTILCN